MGHMLRLRKIERMCKAPEGQTLAPCGPYVRRTQGRGCSRRAADCLHAPTFCARVRANRVASCLSKKQICVQSTFPISMPIGISIGAFQLNMLKKLTVRADRVEWKVQPSSYGTLTCSASCCQACPPLCCAYLKGDEIWFLIPPLRGDSETRSVDMCGIIRCIVQLTSIPVCLEESGRLGGSWVQWKLFWRDWGLHKKLRLEHHTDSQTARDTREWTRAH